MQEREKQKREVRERILIPSCDKIDVRKKEDDVGKRVRRREG